MKIVSMIRCRDEAVVLPWLLANVNCADEVHVTDFGSKDGSQGIILDAARGDPRIHLHECPEHFDWYEREGDQAAIATENAGPADWYVWHDCDEIPNITYQRCLRAWCEQHGHQDYANLGVGVTFLYLCPDWIRYYSEPSRWPDTGIWNYKPKWKLSPIGGRDLSNQPARRITLPNSFMVLHFNWAVPLRFARKRPIYEKRFGYRSWHPDEKFPEKDPVPSGAIWYSPDGKVVGPGDMWRYGPEFGGV